jgi:LCP family protein required for cell wall assembly
MSRRRALAAGAVVAWIVGATLGSAAPPIEAGASRLLAVGKAHASYVPSLTGRRPIFILAIGSDARVEDGTPIERGLGDSVHIIGINPARRRASILGFPRDAWVDIACGSANKLNNALLEGGPECVVGTVEALTGIGIDYWVLTSFEGVKNAVDEVGRLTIDVPFPMRDPFSKSDFKPGTHDLKGFDVLAFARDRHSFSDGDFARSENQGRVLLAALAQFRKEFSQDPSRLFDWIGAGQRNISTSLTIPELLRFGFAATAFDPRDVQNLVVPGTIGMQGPQSVVFLSPAARALYSDMAKDAIVSRRNVPRSPTARERR